MTQSIRLIHADPERGRAPRHAAVGMQQQASAAPALISAAAAAVELPVGHGAGHGEPGLVVHRDEPSAPRRPQQVSTYNNT